MEFELSNSGVVRVVARPLSAADIVAAGTLLAGCEPGLPDGMYATGKIQAWATVVANAIHFGGGALGMYVNGGALAGVAVATVDPWDTSRMLLQSVQSMSAPDETVPQLTALAKRLVNGAGKQLVRKVVTTSYVPV